MARWVIALVAVLALAATANAHARWSCPKPRSANTGIKVGPCGDQTGDFTGDFLTIKPGPMTVVFEESIAHKGAPFRIALSRENDDHSYESCVLLNHIPHNDLNAPVYGDESSYTKTYVTVMIPDVACERCALQLMNPMTDKLPSNGMSNCTYDPACTTCNDGVRCFSNYHSCANVRILGTQPRDQFVCEGQPDNWPWADLPADMYFVGESANYTADNLWLADVPEDFVTPIGPCVE